MVLLKTPHYAMHDAKSVALRQTCPGKEAKRDFHPNRQTHRRLRRRSIYAEMMTKRLPGCTIPQACERLALASTGSTNVSPKTVNIGNSVQRLVDHSLEERRSAPLLADCKRVDFEKTVI